MPRHKERSAALQPGNKYDVPVHLLAAGDGACTSYDSLIVLDGKPTTRSSDHNQLAGLLDRLSLQISLMLLRIRVELLFLLLMLLSPLVGLYLALFGSKPQEAAENEDEKMARAKTV